MRNLKNYCGSLFLCAFIVPFYVYWNNFPSLTFLGTMKIVFVLSIVYCLTTYFFKLFFKDSITIVFFNYFIWGVFWFSFPVLQIFYNKYLIYFDWIMVYRWPLFFVTLCLFVLFVIVFLKKLKLIFFKINQILNVSFFILFFVLTMQCIAINFKRVSNKSTTQKANVLNSQKKLPNIYHILLDAHPNWEGMNFIGGALSPFYHELKKIGFKVYPESRSNYYCTSYSVPSMLNMDYISGDETSLLDRESWEQIKTSKVFDDLKANSYQTHLYHPSNMLACFYDFFDTTDHTDHTDQEKQGKKTMYFYVRSIFENSILKRALIAFFEDEYLNFFKQEIYTSCKNLENGKFQYGNNNQFFYAHILCPHQPFIFANPPLKSSQLNGFVEMNDLSVLLNENGFQAIRQNVYGIDNLILSTIKKILQQYENQFTQPIIILHSDHGCFGCKLAFNNDNPSIDLDAIYGNLLAIYMPNEWHKEAESLEFINLYRFIFNKLLRKNYEYLEQKQIYKGKAVK